MKFFKCNHCGNIVTFAEDKGVPIVCCGEKMTELVPNTTDAATEKHVPLVNVNGSTVLVSVGSAAHPMTAEHSIEWIAVESDQGFQLKHLKADEKPEAVFALADGDHVRFAYAYCNLHGLWRNE